MIIIVVKLAFKIGFSTKNRITSPYLNVNISAKIGMN